MFHVDKHDDMELPGANFDANYAKYTEARADRYAKPSDWTIRSQSTQVERRRAAIFWAAQKDFEPTEPPLGRDILSHRP